MSNPANLGVLVYGAGDLRLAELPEPNPGPDEAVVEVRYGGICGSDLSYWRHGSVGESILRAPMILGHEIAGTVLQAAADGTGPAAGTPVAVHPATPGNGPERFPADRPNLSGGTYLGSAARFPHRDGGFARRVALPSRMLRTLPSGLDLVDGALVEPASVAWHGISRLGEVSGRSALVIGCGPIGLLAVAILAARGAGPITAVDLQEAPLALATQLGASRVLRAPSDAEVQAVDADITLEASGHHLGLASAIRGTTRGGKVLMLGLLPTGFQPALVSLAITKELDLFGSFRFNDEIDEVIDALATGALQARPVVTHVVPATDVAAAFELASDSTRSSKVLLDFAPEAG